ncbi:MAG: TatD family hydrolase [Betaproteobacteria bacterium]
MRWIDTHCHLDAAEFQADVQAVRERARAAGVDLCLIPAVTAAGFDAVRELAHRFGDGYALGLHPLYIAAAREADLTELERDLTRHLQDPRLMAVGEIGLDFFVPSLCTPQMREQQEYFYRVQLLLARRLDLPVILHVRRSADRLLKHLRELAPAAGWRGIAHAFNGSDQQARAFIELGLKLGFGGALTFPRALQLQRLARSLPLQALVLETDAPDIAPQWLYRTAGERERGRPQARNEPAQLPRIGACLADLRGLRPEDLGAQLRDNAAQALPRLARLLNP